MSVRRLFALTVLIALSVACTGRKKRDYEALATRVNATLAALRPTVAPVLAAPADGGGDANAVIGACMTAESQLRPLDGTDFGDADLSRQPGQTQVGVVIGTLIEQRRDMCKEDSGDGTRDRRCRNWCVERWNRLADAVERVRQDAKEQGVNIEPLRNALPVK